MRSSPLGRVLTVAAFLGFATPAMAASPPPGSIGLYSDPDGLSLGAYFGPDPWAPFQGYLLAWPGAEGLKEWELSFSFPPDLRLLGVQLTPSGSVNLGGGNQLIVRLPACAPGPGPVLLATFNFLYERKNPLTSSWYFTIGPSIPSRVGFAGPAWLDCAGALHVFAGTSWSGGGWSFPMGASALCPGPPLIAGTGMGLEDITGAPGDEVGVPATIWNRGFLDCPGYRPELQDIVARFVWDETVATLEGFVPRQMPTGWSWTIEPAPNGGHALHLQGGPGAPYWEASAYNDGIGELRFRLSQTPGSTPVHISWISTITPWWGDVAICSDDGSACWHHDGSLTTQTVPSLRQSMGALKARFADPQQP